MTEKDVTNVPVVDFIAGAVAHRRLYGGGKNQLLAKAIGIKTKCFPSVLDLTAGLGKDAFVLATLSCSVTLVERNNQVFSALEKGIKEAIEYAASEGGELLAIMQRMQLVHQNSLDYIKEKTPNNQPLVQQVIYLDPMFPERKKKAAVKKDMVMLQDIVGDDSDSADLLLAALNTGVHRVVVKRPRHAPNLGENKEGIPQPPLVFKGKSSRFDVYPLRKLPENQDLANVLVQDRIL